MHNLTKIKLFRTLLWMSYPLALIFVLPFSLMKRKAKSHLFFFFDRYAIGGAQRIHLDILESVADVPKQLYFTRSSEDHSLKDAFFGIPNTKAKDIHFWCDNLLFRLFTVHYYSFYINRHKNAHVFSANSTFFYDMLPFLRKGILKTELLHNFTGGKNGMEFFGLANVASLNFRIVYDSYTLNNIKGQYASHQVPDQYLGRIKFIEPGVFLPDKMPVKSGKPLRILYAGRGGAQKRIDLLNTIAERCIGEGLPVEFHFAGTMINELSETVKSSSVIHGQISRQEDMAKLYTQCHVLLMTSAYEGFPMAIKESMAYACIPVVTALEGNKMHLSTGNNALLIEQVDDREAVIEGGIRWLRLLIEDGALKTRLSAAVYEYAREHFSRQRFMDTYRAFLNNP